MRLHQLKIAVLASVLGLGTSNAALQSRAGGNAYYDDVLNITWLADADLAATRTFGVAGITVDGYMNWSTAESWITAMNTANYLGIHNWRLPTVTDTAAPGCDFAYAGTDCGFNVDVSTGEMAHLFYGSLQNTSNFSASGSPMSCDGACHQKNAGPFQNLQAHPESHWTGTSYAPAGSSAWSFSFDSGLQHQVDKTAFGKAWAVTTGDLLLPVPVPAAVWLFASALGLMAFRRRT